MRSRTQKLLGALVVLSCSASAQQYLVSTIAGGAPPLTPAPALGSSVGATNTVACDAAGNCYFTGGQNVFKINSNGILTVFAGNSRRGFSGDGGPAVSAQLYDPFGVALDASGDLYIADELNNRVRKVSLNGIITTVAGNGTAGFAGDGAAAVDAELHFPLNVAVDNAGNLYIGDQFNNRIRKVTPAGIISTFGGGGNASPGDGGPATSAVLAGPSGMAIDSQGNVYVAERYGMRLRKIAPDGTLSTVAGNGTQGFSGDGGPATSAQLYLPSDVTLDPTGNLYIADSGNNKIREVSSSGTITSIAPGNGPTGVALDHSGNLFFADRFDYLIQKITPINQVLVVAGNLAQSFSGDGGPATSAQMNLVTGIVVDSFGNLYIADELNGRVRRVSPSGVIGTLASGFVTPRSLALDSAGNVYVSDQGGNKVFKVTPAGVATAVCGTGVQGYSGDGGAAINAQLSNPAGLAVDASGNLFIADSGNNRIRKVTPAGIVTTLIASDLPPGPVLFFGPQDIAVNSAGTLFIANGTSILSVTPTGAVSTYVSQPSLDAGGMAFDAAGNLYVTNQTANGVQKIPPNGTVATIAGSGAAGFSGDGGPASIAQFYNPEAIAVDGSGRVYVADTLNYAVRLLQPVNTSIFVSAVVDAASEGVAPVSPGKIVAIYGDGLGPSQLVVNQPANGVFSTSVGGTAVTFNNIAAPLLYTSATQVGAIVPYGVTGSTAQVAVAYQGQVFQPFAVPVAATAPGIFTTNQTGAGQAAAINDLDGTLNGAANPVEVGGYISLFLTGEGQTIPPGVDGKVGGAVATHPNAAVSVTVGGVPAVVQYAGGVAGIVAGLMQVNVQIPAGVQAGGYVPVVVQVGNAVSGPGIWIAVAGN